MRYQTVTIAAGRSINQRCQAIRRQGSTLALTLLTLLLTFSTGADAQGLVFPTPIQQFTDDNGDPIAGAKLCSYAAGTSTPQAVYTDSALTVPHTNPVIADAAGRATIYLSRSVSYKFVLMTPGSDSTCSTGSIVWTVDNVSLPADVTPATPEAVPTGTILSYGDTTAPTGYLLCNGVAVDRTTYAALYAVIGTTYGAGDGLTTFNLPNTDAAYVNTWTTWTPTWTNLTVGNGTVVARYTRVGKTVQFKLRLQFGTTTSISGDVSLSLPVTASDIIGMETLGVASFFDSGVGLYDGAGYAVNATTLSLISSSGAQTSVTATTPFTWTTNDALYVSGTYEAAAAVGACIIKT